MAKDDWFIVECLLNDLDAALALEIATAVLQALQNRSPTHFIIHYELRGCRCLRSPKDCVDI